MKKKGIKKGKLQIRITRIVLFPVLVAFFMIFIVVISTSYNYYRTQEIVNQRNQVDKTAAQISNLQSTIGNIAKQVIYDDVVQKGIAAPADSTGIYLYQRRKVQETLTTYSHIISSIHEIMIYTEDGRTFSSRDIKDPFDPEKNPWYKDFWESGRTSGYTKIHPSEADQDGYQVDVMSYMLSYYSVENAGKELGKLVVSVKLNELEKMVQLDSDLLEGYCLYDSNAESVISYGKLKKSYKQIKAENEDGIIESSHGDVYIVANEIDDNCLLVSEISGIRLMEQAVRGNLYLLAIFAIIMGALLYILPRVIRQIVTPVNQLSAAAIEVGQGNFDVSVDIHTDDELEMLADVFNKMVVDIQDYMHQSVEHEKVLRRMQIENLMLQINPHFIYNTMNSIVYMARMSGNGQIADFANAFISLLQSTLDVRDSVYQTVRKELCTVENYLYLQKYRYADKFTYEINCAEDLMDCEILNVMVQPAVENAIFHGIVPKEENCKLKISVCKEKEHLVVSVEDNGVGMSPETLAEQMRPGHEQKGGVRKIGVANVRNRIREIYGEPYDLVIESELGVGTKVIMTVPYVKTKEVENNI